MPTPALVGPLRADDIDDVDAVVRLLGLLFAQEADFAPDPARQRAALEQLVAAPDLGVVLVARAGGRVVGCVSLLRTVSTALGGEVAWLEDLVVDPAARGDGVGTTLLAAAAATAAERGWRRISLVTDRGNDGARRLYRRHGFVESAMVVLRRPVR